MAAEWKSQIRPASFRDVPFFVKEAELRSGRKAVAFEYPYRDGAFVEDLGRRARRYEVEAFVIGSNYLADKAMLIAALETQGPGTLVHPYYGTLMVAVHPEFTVKESTSEGGWARFGIDFIETEEKPFSPSAFVEPGSQCTASADATLVGVQNSYVRRYITTLPNGDALPSASQRSVAGVLSDWSTAVKNAMQPIVHETQSLAAMKRQLDHIVVNASTLVRTPVQVVTQLGLVSQSLVRWPDTPRLGVRALISAYKFVPTIGRPIATTTTRRIEQNNYDLTLGLVKTLTIAHASRLASDAVRS